jgi:uncharacterized protein (DUF58 family)
VNFQRLNHILVPATSEQRDQLRRGRIALLIRPVMWAFNSLSEEGQVMAVLMLFIGTAAGEVATTEVYILWAVLVGVLVGAVVVRRFYKLVGVRMTVSAPARIAVGAPTTFTLSLHNSSERDHLSLRVGGPFLPWDGTWLRRGPRVRRLEAGESTRVEMNARFVQRGHHHLDAFQVRAVVPFGLSVGPRVSSSTLRFVVVPRIAPIAQLSLPTGSSYQPGGVARASHTGEAMELMGVRPYRAGDPVRDLHPKTWARMGTPHVRVYQQEYFTRIGVIIDNDEANLSEEGFEATISLAAGVVARLTRGEALIDLLVMGGEVHALTIGRALGTLDQALDVLAAAEPAAAIDNDELVARMGPYLQRISSIIIITQSSDPSRLELVKAIERRGIAVRILRVHDDSGPAILAKSRKRLAPRIDAETVHDVTRINDDQSMIL